MIVSHIIYSTLYNDLIRFCLVVASVCCRQALCTLKPAALNERHKLTRIKIHIAMRDEGLGFSHHHQHHQKSNNDDSTNSTQSSH